MRASLRTALVTSVIGAVLVSWTTAVAKSRSRKKSPLPPVRTVGSMTGVAALEPYRVDGIGLVVGLNGTGSNPAPDQLRTRLIEKMHREKLDDADAQELLASPDTALVLVKAFIPAGAREGDSVDVEVIVPPGSDASSLRGGWLLETDLSQLAQISGRIHTGTVLAQAQGPLVVSPRPDSASGGTSQLRGRILGGAKLRESRNLAIVLADRYEGPLVLRVQNAINSRFHNVAGSLSKGAAEAKNGERIDLKIDEHYRYNIPRYLSVVRQLAVSESGVERHERMVELERFLLSDEVQRYPGAVLTAVLQLEGMGSEGRRVLKRVLEQSKDSEVRFFAAEGLAYLGEPACAKQLGVAAREEPAFRVFALAALVALREPAAVQVLRELMDESSAELRYGAFRALWTLDHNDPELRGRNLYERCWLHELATQGPPMVHVTWNFRPEVVLFGKDQQLLAPAFLTAGPDIIIKSSADSGEVVIKAFSDAGPTAERRCSLRLRDVLETIVAMGAGYPEVVQLLSQAQQRHNLQGSMCVEAIPRAGRLTARWRALLEENEGKQQAGLLARLPGLFPGDTAAPTTSRDGAPPDDASQAGDEEPDQPPEKRGGFFGKLKLFSRSGD